LYTLAGVFGAKAIGEPAVLFGISSVLAIKQALNAGKVDVGVDPTQWFDLRKFIEIQKEKLEQLLYFYFRWPCYH